MGLGTSETLWGEVRVSAAEAAEYELALSAKRTTEIPSCNQVRCDYTTRTDGQPVYLGFGPRGLASSENGWLLHKFTYDTYGQCTLRQVAYDIWDNRATATYA